MSQVNECECGCANGVMLPIRGASLFVDATQLGSGVSKEEVQQMIQEALESASPGASTSMQPDAFVRFSGSTGQIVHAVNVTAVNRVSTGSYVIESPVIKRETSFIMASAFTNSGAATDWFSSALGWLIHSPSNARDGLPGLVDGKASITCYTATGGATKYDANLDVFIYNTK